VIDLYSDTVTQPTDEMYDAMRAAPLGDAVIGNCPTVRRLEEMAAERLGKEAALFTPGGMMANRLAIRVQSQFGHAVISETLAHLYRYGIVGSVGRTSISIRGKRGLVSVEQIREQLDAVNQTPIDLITLENTHNYAGGTILPLEEMKAIAELAWARDVRIHLDGARIFNVAVASGVPAREFAHWANSVMFCLSKGLAAPIGSLLVGDAATIERARAIRYRMGGGMRKAGLAAAAGIVALETMVERLAEDHDNALALAQGLSGIPGVGIDMEGVQTNIVMVDVSGIVSDAQVVKTALEERGVRVSQTLRHAVRMVTHFGITRGDIEQTIKVFREVVQSLASA
jgi:threonine aldolase